MRPKESSEIASLLAGFTVQRLSPMIELGSSTAQFRRVEKPHIENNLHRPLRSRGIELVTTDIKEGDGIDISGNIYDAQLRAKFKEIQPRALMCCNILEHLENRREFAHICSDILSNDGILIVSVPFDYPYHPDPIDTMYRPTPGEVADLFPEFTVKFSTIVTDGNYYQDLRAMGYWVALVSLLKSLVKLIWLIATLKFNLIPHHRLFYLFRDYKVTIVVLEKSLIL